MTPLRRQHTRFLWLLLVVVGANYLAQIPYYLHLYYFPRGLPPSPLGVALLGATCAWFLAGYIGLARGRAAGYWLLLAFLLTEVGFYAHGVIIRVANGYPALQNMQTHDPVLLIIYGIGYLNMVMGVYFYLLPVAPSPRAGQSQGAGSAAGALKASSAKISAIATRVDRATPSVIR